MYESEGDHGARMRMEAALALKENLNAVSAMDRDDGAAREALATVRWRGE